ncbi:ubiquitin--protein ligase [Teladorsagia circumcincta]|uniref:Ubiquitin--protein ligase n=1 Tax=Teladorsagia circumcincta TaxID=45464 RepID=A0A2G9UBS5_TELCI|nr:ubiquitin--protein ligase [Teladorsagia circumcincta]
MNPVFFTRESFPQPSGQPNPAAVRRLQRDFEKLRREPIDGIEAVPDDANILIWHYVIKGSPDTPYEGGYYYGKIVFQPDFPWKPPAICMLTPNGSTSQSTGAINSLSNKWDKSPNPCEKTGERHGRRAQKRLADNSISVKHSFPVQSQAKYVEVIDLSDDE